MGERHVTSAKRLVWNTVTNLATLVSSIVIGFCLIRFFLGQLGAQRYGIWLLVGSIFRYSGMLTLGLNSAVSRYIPVSLAKNDKDAVQRVISTALLFYSSLAIIVLLATLVVYHNIDVWFVIESELVVVAGVVVLAVGICGTLMMPLQLFSAVLGGIQRYDMVNLALLASLFIRTALLVVLLLHGYGLIAMGLVFGCSEICVALLHFIFARKFLSQPLISFKKLDVRLFREMLAYGVNTFLYAMGALIMYKASDIIIGIFLGTSEISQFSIAAAGVLLIAQFVQVFAAAINPAVADLGTRNDRSRVLQIAFLTQKYTLLLIIPAGCFLLLMGKEFLGVWVGDKFQDPSIIESMSVILSILTFGHCLRVAQHSNFLVLVGCGEHRVFGILTILTALLCIGGSIISVMVFNWGLIGIAWSNCLPLALISGTILPVYFNWKMKISLADSIKHVWWPALVGTVPAIVTLMIWKHLAAPNSWIQLFSVVIVVGTITLLTSWYLSFTSLERKRFLDMVPGWLRVRKKI